jgi:hypothetical protein
MFSLTELPNNQEEVGKLLVKVRLILACAFLMISVPK